MRKVILVIIVLIMCMLMPSIVQSTELDYTDGHFEKKLISCGVPIKLKDGRVLLLSLEENIIYDFKNESKGQVLKKKVMAPLVFPYELLPPPYPAILLNNGKVLVFGDLPGSKTLDDGWRKFKTAAIEYMLRSRLDKDFLTLKLKEKKQFRRDLWDEYNKMPDEEREKIYRAVINSSPELKEFDDLRQKRVDIISHALLYDPETDTFEFTGKTTFNPNPLPSNRIAVLKSDGNVLFFAYASGEVEEYDVASGQFKLLNTRVDSFELPRSYLTDSRLINPTTVMLLGNNNYIFYDTQTNKYYNRGTFLINDKVKFCHFINDNEVLCFGSQETQALYVCDIKTKTCKLSAKLKVPRIVEYGNYFTYFILPDKQVLIMGGDDATTQDWYYGRHDVTNKAEIINLNAGESRILKKMPFRFNEGKPILLDDGRVIIFCCCTIYIPKGYKQKGNK